MSPRGSACGGPLVLLDRHLIEHLPRPLPSLLGHMPHSALVVGQVLVQHLPPQLPLDGRGNERGELTLTDSDPDGSRRSAPQGGVRQEREGPSLARKQGLAVAYVSTTALTRQHEKSIQKHPPDRVSAGQRGLESVEPRRFELLTSALQRQRSTN